MKIGFIGHGRHAKNNLYPSLKYLGVEVSAISTNNIESALIANKEQQVDNTYSDYKEMLKSENLDGVVISVDGKIHPQMVIDSLEAGSNVYVEKPLSESLEESVKVQEIANKTGKFVMVGFMKRYSPNYSKINELLPKIGTITSINTTFGCRNFSKDASEYLLQAAIHMVNMTTAYVGEYQKLNVVSSSIDKNFTLIVSALNEENVAISMNLIAADSWSKLNEEIIITGTKGYIKFNNNSGLQLHINEYETSYRPRWQLVDEITTNFNTVSTTSSGSYQQLYHRGFIPALEHFIDCIKNKKKPITDSGDNLTTMRWIDAILKEI